MIRRLLMCALPAWLLATSSLGAAEPLRESGQSTFAAIAEAAAALSEDSTTDWSRVSLLALREHLVDMNEVLTRAVVAEEPIDGGVGIRVTGDGRTLEALLPGGRLPLGVARPPRLSWQTRRGLYYRLRATFIGNGVRMGGSE